MAAFKTFSESKSNVTSSAGGTSFDVAPYSKLYVHILPTASTGGALKLQTSNDGTNWIDVHDFSTVTANTNYGLNVPYGATAAKEGFGRYVRLYATLGTTLSYQAWFIARE